MLALEIYLAFYATCLALTWWFYLHKGFRSPRPVRQCCRRARRDGSQWSIGTFAKTWPRPPARPAFSNVTSVLQASNDHAKIPRSLAGMKRKLVVVGAGMASGRVLEHLLKAARDAYEVTLFGAEPRGNYNRIMLSPVLAGEATYEEIVTHTDAWYAGHNIALPVRRNGHQNRSRGQDGAYAKWRNTLRQVGDRHRLGAFRHSGGWQGIAGRALRSATSMTSMRCWRLPEGPA